MWDHLKGDSVLFLVHFSSAFCSYLAPMELRDLYCFGFWVVFTSNKTPDATLVCIWWLLKIAHRHRKNKIEQLHMNTKKRLILSHVAKYFWRIFFFFYSDAALQCGPLAFVLVANCRNIFAFLCVVDSWCFMFSLLHISRSAVVSSSDHATLLVLYRYCLAGVG